MLNIRLTQRLFDAGVVRIQLLKARDANQWPDVHSSLRFQPGLIVTDKASGLLHRHLS